MEIFIALLLKKCSLFSINQENNGNMWKGNTCYKHETQNGLARVPLQTVDTIEERERENTRNKM